MYSFMQNRPPLRKMLLELDLYLEKVLYKKGVSRDFRESEDLVKTTFPCLRLWTPLSHLQHRFFVKTFVVLDNKLSFVSQSSYA